MLDICKSLCYNSQRSERNRDMREWRNRQTRTFEGRVVIPYGFKSRLSHQERIPLRNPLFTTTRKGLRKKHKAPPRCPAV